MRKSGFMTTGRQDRAAFTLLELLIVLAIILVIAAMVVPNLIGSQQKALINTTYTAVKKMEAEAGKWAADHDGTYLKATGGQDVWTQFIQPPKYRGRQIKPYFEEVPMDAWGNVLQYEWDGSGHSKKQNAQKPAIWSWGPNGTDDGGQGDDINNWTPQGAANQQ